MAAEGRCHAQGRAKARDGASSGDSGFERCEKRPGFKRDTHMVTWQLYCQIWLPMIHRVVPKPI